MVKINSPQVTVIEKDDSLYPPTLDSSIVGILGFASKGPTDKATLITSQEQLVRTFGEPEESITGQGLEGALEILEATNQVYFARAASSTAVEASAFMSFGSCPAINVSSNGYGVTTNLYLKAQVWDNDGVAYWSSPKEFAIVTGTATTQASALRTVIGGTLDSDPIGVFWDSTASGYIVGAWAGSGAALGLSAYSESTYTTGVSALMPLSPSSGDAWIVNEGSFVTSGGTSSLKVWGSTISTLTSSIEYLVQSKYPGAGYVLGTKSNGLTSGLSIEVDNLGGPYFNVVVNEDGVAKETFRTTLIADEFNIETVIEDDLTNATSDNILGEITFSGLPATPTTLATFTAKLSTMGATHVSGTFRVATNGTSTGLASSLPIAARFIKLVEATNGLAGGTNGIPTASDDIATVLIGTSTGGARTGMQLLNDDLLNISIALVPGISIQSVQNALISLAETSQEFLAVVAPPVGFTTPQEAIDWSNGRSQTRTAAINSSFAAIGWPWVKVFSAFDGKDRWYDPSIFMVRQMCVTDNLAETWFAPAGLRRGRLTKPTDVEIKLNLGDRDALYSGGNVINPIAKFPQDGIVIFGQRTAQRFASALDRINVRRLVIFIRKILLIVGKPFIFEPNDSFLWQQIEESVNPFLDDIKRRRGLIDFRVICDETTNTPARVDRNELWCKIVILPTKAAEAIVFELNLTNSSSKLGLS